MAGQMIGGPSAVQCMNHAYLNTRSDIFADDKFDSVEKRCFFLMCGKQSSDSALTIDIAVNIFDDPRTKKNLQVSVFLDHVIVEYNNEILKSLTSVLLEYKVATMFSDLHGAMKASKLNKNKSLMRMIELQAPLYALKKQILKGSINGNFDESIKDYHKKWIIKIEDTKPHTQKQRE